MWCLQNQINTFFLSIYYLFFLILGNSYLKGKEDVAKHIIHGSFVKKESETLEVSGDLFTLQYIIKTPYSLKSFCASFLD